MESLSQLFLFSLTKFVDQQFNNLSATIGAIFLKEDCFTYENFLCDHIPPIGL